MAEAQPPWVKNPSRSTRRRGGRGPSADDSSETRVAPADAPPQSPLDFTLAVMRDPLKPDALRASLAKAALPYVHGRWCPLGSDPRDAQVGSTRLAPLNDAKERRLPSFDRPDAPATEHNAHEDSLIRHARPCAGHPRLSFPGGEDVDGRDEPGHDENKERALVREMEQRALTAQARLRESEQRAVAAESRVADLEARESATLATLARVKTQWPDIFDATGAVRAPAASERDRLAQLVTAQERARSLEERAIMAEGALREAQFRARDMEQRACAAEALIAGRR